MFRVKTSSINHLAYEHSSACPLFRMQMNSNNFITIQKPVENTFYNRKDYNSAIFLIRYITYLHINKLTLKFRFVKKQIEISYHQFLKN